MDFKVKCVRVRKYPEYFTEGKIYEVKNNKVICNDGSSFETWSYARYGNADFEAFSKWFRPWYGFELVEEKKVFTKKDLKNGDVVLKRNGNVEIIILPLGTMVTKTDGHNKLSEMTDNLKDINGCSAYDIVAVRRPSAEYECSFGAFKHNLGKLVYDRERDTKPRYNGKVVCIDLNGYNERNYTVGKIYEFKDGKMIADGGWVFGEHFGEEFYTFDDWSNFSNSKFIEIKE